jgi:hypothetical protein
MVDELLLLKDRVECLDEPAGEFRERLRHCLAVAARPQDSIALARSIGENLAKRVLQEIGLKPPAMLDGCLREFEKPEVMSRGLVPAEVVTILHVIRVLGNKAVHDSLRIEMTAADVHLVLRSTLRVVEWYFLEFDRGPKLDRLFLPPKKGEGQPDGSGPDAPALEGTFTEVRRKVYDRLWRRLEDAHVKIRTEEVEGERFLLLLRDVNTFILHNSAYLEDDIHLLANTYLGLLKEFRDGVIECGDAGLRSESLATLPPADVPTLGGLFDLFERVKEVRSELLGKVRAVLTDDSASGTKAPRKKPWWKFW